MPGGVKDLLFFGGAFDSHFLFNAQMSIRPFTVRHLSMVYILLK